MSHLNPNHLLTFATVARLSSITRAAEALHLGQPAVSGQLKLLQEQVGEPLYERKGHAIELTAAGRGLLEYAEQLQRNLQQVQAYIRCLQNIDTGELKIGSTMTIASYFLPRYLVRLQTLHPGLQLYMTTGSTVEVVKALNELDLGFIEGSVAEADLPPHCQMLLWREDEIVLMVREDHELALACPDAVPLQVFADYPVIWREPGSGARQVVEQALQAAGIHAPVTIEVTGVAGVKGAVRAGLGIGFASLQALHYERSGLVARRIAPPTGLKWQLNLIAPKASMRSRATQVFLDLCIEEELL